MKVLAKEVETIKHCANSDCNRLFAPTRHNQKYCSKECCKVVTNAKIMQQYYEKKDRKSGKKRICDSCNVTELSRYNESTTCQSCVLQQRAAGRFELLQLMGVA